MDYPLKIKILQFLISSLEDVINSSGFSTSVLTLDFTLQQLEDDTGEYKPSISREIRSLKDAKVISYVCMNKRLGQYRILLDKSGYKSAKALRDRLQKRMTNMMNKKKSEIWQTKRLLHDAAAGISKMSPKSEIIQS